MKLENLKKIVFGLFCATSLVFFSNLIGNMLVANQETKGPLKTPLSEPNIVTEKSSGQLKTLASNSNDLEHGKKIFRKCKACHSIVESGRSKIGPNLWGILGKKIGSAEDFRYSTAMQNLKGEWNYNTLDQFLMNPKEYLPGTKMSFSGLKDGNDRKNLILYMKSQKKP